MDGAHDCHSILRDSGAAMGRVLVLKEGGMLLIEALFDEIITTCAPLAKNGEVASYIPALQDVDPFQFGISVADNHGKIYSAGDSDVRFSIQSISKVFIFTCALIDSGVSRVLERVSIEPTSDSFNSIISLELKNSGKPLNPMINAGAIACLALIAGESSQEKVRRVLAIARDVSGNRMVDIDENVYLSEKNTDSRNRALAYYMKSTGIIAGDVETLLDAYFRICSVRMDCLDLAKTALLYAGNGVSHYSGGQVFCADIARLVKATMTMCGMYDESGRVAASVGLPTKSGVGGGILSIVPEHRTGVHGMNAAMGIGIYGPALNAKGSSIAGLNALEMFSQRLKLSIF